MMARRSSDAEKIRRALDVCLSGVDELPSQRAEILRRARGEQIVKKKISQLSEIRKISKKVWSFLLIQK